MWIVVVLVHVEAVDQAEQIVGRENVGGAEELAARSSTVVVASAGAVLLQVVQDVLLGDVVAGSQKQHGLVNT